MTTSNDKGRSWLAGLVEIARDEFISIGTSYSTLLLLVGGVFIYGFLYNLMYMPNLVRNAPIAVITPAETEFGREYVSLINATPQLKVMYNALDINQAKELIQRRDVIGAVYLPSNFDRQLMNDESATALVFGNTATFLYFEALQEALNGAMLAVNNRMRPTMVGYTPFYAEQAIAKRAPINVVGEAVYNPTMGYGTYLLPPVLMIILFQTLMMAVAMSIGAKIYDRSLCLLAREGVDFKYLSRIVIGYAVVYFGLYIIFSFFMLGLIPLIFDLPNIGDAFSILTMMVPFLLGTCFMSLAFSFFYTDKDQPLLMITFFSVPLVFLSGISYPLELMPEFWQWWHYLFPATSGALAFVKLNCMDASLYDIRVEYLTMWIQCIVYFFLACAAIRFNLRRCCEITPQGVVPKGHRYDD